MGQTTDNAETDQNQDQNQNQDQDQEQAQPDGRGPDPAEKAQKAEEAYEAAQKKMKELEEMDEPPSDLDEWPDDEAKYVTFGGGEGDHSYAEGPETKLGPSELERRADGSVWIEGEEVDNPDDYKADPVPGGPTDPNSPEMHGERKRREKMKKMYGEEAIPDALRKSRERAGADDSEDEERSENEDREESSA
jgi:hypothetical protein